MNKKISGKTYILPVVEIVLKQREGEG